MWRGRLSRVAAPLLARSNKHLRLLGEPAGSPTSSTQVETWGEGRKPWQHSSLPCTSDGLVRGREGGEGEGVTLLFPAGRSQEMFLAAGRFSVYNIATTLTINSSTPLPASVFEEALHHLQRKVPSLRTCFRRKGDQLWVCELRDPTVDFKVESCGLEEVENAILGQVYDSQQGPLWCARLLPCHASDPCPMPEVRPMCPHQYHLTFGFHHGANDGVSAALVIMATLKLLRGVVRGTPIEAEPLGTLVTTRHTQQIEKAMKTELEQDPQRLKRLLKEFEAAKFSPLLADAFGFEAESHQVPEAVHCTIDSGVMGRFAKKCKAAELSLFSGMSCVVDRALVELVREAGLQRDPYSVTSRHPINERRYWNGNPLTEFGSSIGHVYHTMEGSFRDRLEFWPYAKLFHDQFREKMASKQPQQERLLREMTPDFSYESYYQKTQPLTADYSFTNIILSGFTPWGTEDNKLQATGWKLFVNINNTTQSNSHIIGNFRGNVSYSLLYRTNHLTREVAQSFQNKVKTTLESLAG